MADTDDSLEATKAGATWQTSEDETVQPPEQVTHADAVHGDVEDPNLGDIPLDRQRHPDAD